MSSPRQPERVPGSTRPQWVGRAAVAVLVLLAGAGGLWAAYDGPGAATTNASPSPTPVRHPDSSTTGVPRGVALRPSGPIKITQAGTVVDGLDVTGSITVEADDVTIRNTRIRGTGGAPVVLRGTGLLVEDTEIDGQGKGNPAIGYRDYVLRRVDIHDVAEGPRIAGGNVTIEDSYIHNLVQVGGNHTDAVQVVGGQHIVVRGNTLAVDNPTTGSQGNAAFQFGEEDSAVADCLVEGNLLDGGNYTVNGGGGGTKGAQCTFRGNVFGGSSRYGAATNLGPGVTWDDTNVWEATGRPVR